MSLIVQQGQTSTPIPGATLTVQDILGKVQQDVRFQFGSTTVETTLLIDYINRVSLDLQRWSRWQFLLSAVNTFPTVVGETDYYVGTDGLPVGAVDTGLAIPDMKAVKRDSVFDRTNFRSLFPTSEAPLLQSAVLNDFPRWWRNDISTGSVINIYPPSSAVANIEFRFYVLPNNLANLADPIQIPDKYQDVLIAGVNEKAFIYLKRQQEAAYWAGEYQKGKTSIIRDFNQFPRGAEYISPDPVSQSRTVTGDWFYDVLYNIK